MDQSLRHLVHERALDKCEYCQMPKQYDLLPFQVDHIVAEKHRGPTHEGNLALTCYNCNGHKGSNIAGRDRVELRKMLMPWGLFLSIDH